MGRVGREGDANMGFDHGYWQRYFVRSRRWADRGLGRNGGQSVGSGQRANLCDATACEWCGEPWAGQISFLPAIVFSQLSTGAERGFSAGEGATRPAG